MKLDKMVLFGVFGMVLTFGLVSPQDVAAADAAGILKLEAYLANVVTGKKLDNKEVDEIENIIRQDGKVDDEEYEYIYNILESNDYFDQQILSSELCDIILSLHNDYASYHNDVTKKYPELIDLDNKLPIDLRNLINKLVLTNLIVEEDLSGSKKFFESDKKAANNDLALVSRKLKELQDALPSSPYREFLTKVYNAEKLLLEENLKGLSAR